MYNRAERLEMGENITRSEDTYKPLRLGISGSSFIWAMAPSILTAASAGEKFDEEQNRLMLEFMHSQMAALRKSRVRSMECYHMLAWDPDPVVATILESMDDDWSIELRTVHAPYGQRIDPSLPGDDIRDAALKSCAATLNLVKRLGAQMIVVHPGANVSAPINRTERLMFSVQNLTEIADMAAAEDVLVAVETMPKQEVGNTIEELIWIIDNIDRPNVGACLDTNHLFPASCLPGTIKKLGPRLFNVHASDHDGAGECHWLPYEGVVDWASVIKALREVDYRGPLILEVHGTCKGTCEETVAAVEKSYARLEQVIDSAQENAGNLRLDMH